MTSDLRFRSTVPETFAADAGLRLWQDVGTWCASFLLFVAGLFVTGLFMAGGAPVAHAQTAPGPAMTATEVVDASSILSGRDTPVWSPGGETVAFMSTLRGGLDLLGVAPDGSSSDPFVVAEDLTLVGTGTPGSQKPQYSPDGRYVAYVSSKEGPADDGPGGTDLTEGGDAPEIWLRDLEAGSDRQLTALGSRINALRWSPDSNTLLITSDRYGSQDVWTVDVASGAATRLTASPLYETYPDWTPDGEEIVYVQMNDAWTDHTVYRMPAGGGEAERVVEDTDFFDYRAGLAFGTPRVSPGGEHVLFRSLRSGWHGYWLARLDGEGEPIAIAPAEADQSHARWSPSGDRILYLENHNGTVDLRVVTVTTGGEDVALGEPAVLVEPGTMAATYGRETLSMGSAGEPAWSPDGEHIAFSYATPVQPKDLFVVRLADGAITRLTESVPAGATARLQMPEKISYESTNGYTIDGYYHAPMGLADGETAPAIVWVHGGPTSQFSDDYRRHHQVHYFAQQGYAVLMPNVRGSSGYGKAFEDANNDCWGRCDLEDVRAGVDWLTARPEVDGSKRGITGTSYGGILSMAAVTFAPGLFQAAIPISGYANMADFHTEVPELQHIKLLDYELGTYPENKDLYERHSPIHYVADVTTPTFLIHGEGRNVPWRPAQRDPEMASIDFARALDQEYKIFRYKSFPGESYYVYGRDNTIQKLTDMDAFFHQFLRDRVVDRSGSPPLSVGSRE
jgi:dipeptidyl aminopeptidase/acylaminoacyl peptidase